MIVHPVEVFELSVFLVNCPVDGLHWLLGSDSVLRLQGRVDVGVELQRLDVQVLLLDV